MEVLLYKVYIYPGNLHDGGVKIMSDTLRDVLGGIGGTYSIESLVRPVADVAGKLDKDLGASLGQLMSLYLGAIGQEVKDMGDKLSARGLSTGRIYQTQQEIAQRFTAQAMQYITNLGMQLLQAKTAADKFNAQLQMQREAHDLNMRLQQEEAKRNQERWEWEREKGQKEAQALRDYYSRPQQQKPKASPWDFTSGGPGGTGPTAWGPAQTEGLFTNPPWKTEREREAEPSYSGYGYIKTLGGTVEPTRPWEPYPAGKSTITSPPAKQQTQGPNFPNMFGSQRWI